MKKAMYSKKGNQVQIPTNNHPLESMIQLMVEKALLNVSGPLIENVVERVIARKFEEDRDEPLDVIQAAALIRRKPQTVYSYCSKGLIPFHKMGEGGKSIFFRSELLEWLKNNQQKKLL